MSTNGTTVAAALDNHAALNLATLAAGIIIAATIWVVRCMTGGRGDDE